MSRNNKKTRLKGEPPRVQQQILDSVTGSYPTVSRLASDNRSGVYNTFYDDTKTLNFITYSGSFLLGTSHPVVSPFIPAVLDQTSSMVGTGSLRKGVSDTPFLVHFSPGQDSRPFRDHDRPEVDGKFHSNPFYATGSRVEDAGPGFSGPLWAKSKIEIDLTPRTLSGITSKPEEPTNGYSMAYFNFEHGHWDPMGRGEDLASKNQRSGSFGDLFRSCSIGFNPSIGIRNNHPMLIRGAGHPSVEWGFPLDARYHATSSQLLPLNTLINRPFLAEKVVLLISASFFGNIDTYGAGNFEGDAPQFFMACNTFFVMNQRSPYKIYREFGQVPLTTVLPAVELLGNSPEYTTVTTVRDLVTYANVVSVGFQQSDEYEGVETPEGTSIFPDYSRELIIRTPLIFWDQPLILSGVIQSPTVTPEDLFTSGLSNIQVGIVQLTNGPRTSSEFQAAHAFGFGGRNSLGFERITGRDLRVPVVPTRALSSSTGGQLGGIMWGDRYSYPNPYLLLPGDQLVVGWQIAQPIGTVHDSSNPESGLTLSFPPVPATLIIYGSSVVGGEESHDTLNQLLSSDVVHEVIE